MEFLGIFIALVLFLLVKGCYDKKKAEKHLVSRLRDTWGTLPDSEYSEEKFLSLQYYYKNKTKDPSAVFELDEITWNDLDMTELFFRLNATGSAMGEEVLWALLHELQINRVPLEERESVISFFQTDAKARARLRKDFYQIGKNKKISVYEYMDRLSNVRRESNAIHYAGVTGIVLSLLLLLCSIKEAGILLLGCLIFNLITYYKRKGEIELYYSVISYLIRMLKHAEKLSEEKIPELTSYFNLLREHTVVLKNFCKGAPAVTPENPTGDMMSFLLDYIRIIFHTDLIRFNRMMKQYFEHRERIVQVFELIGFLDSMCAVASFRASLAEYCLPEFTKEKQYHVEELFHPFLTKPVPATMRTEHSVLVTGSNASGKSTFIKAAALAAVMAQTIHTVCAKGYTASFFKVYTSMALKDDLFGNESYYIVEIKSLKRILDAIKGELPVLCFVDEILRGTNTVERIAASSRILLSIAGANALMFAATHDIELTYMLEAYFENYHFEEKILENRILFDYQLKRGRATSQNAISLLGLLDYPETIIQEAKKTAAHFIQSGEWEKFEN